MLRVIVCSVLLLFVQLATLVRAEARATEWLTWELPGTLLATKGVLPNSSSTDEADATETLAIVGAAIHTMERDGVIEEGIVLIQDGRIVAVGTGLEIPEDARKIDATGYHLTPGLIDVRSRLYLGASSADQSATDGSLDAVDGVDWWDSSASEVLAAGVTSVYVQPTAAGTFGGYGATLPVTSIASMENAALSSTAAAQMSLGGGTRGGTSRARRQQFEALQRRLKEAKDYQKAWEDYRKAEAEKEKASTESSTAKPSETSPAESTTDTPNPGRPRRRPPRESELGQNLQGVQNELDENLPHVDFEQSLSPPSRPQEERPSGQAGDAEQKPTEEAESKPASEAPKKPTFDPLKERLLPILDRQMLVRFEVQRAEEIGWALELAKEFNLRIVLDGIAEMKSALQVVQDSQNPVVLGPWIDFSDSSDAEKHRKQWSKAFGASGQSGGGSNGSNRVAIATFSTTPHGSKWLRHHAAVAISEGFSPAQAMRAITIEAARVAGVADQVGSIAVGKRADLVLFAGEPHDTTAPVALVVQAGTVVRDRMTETQTRAAERSPEDVNLSQGTKTTTELSLPTPTSTSYVLISKRVLSSDGDWRPAAIVVKDGRIVSVNAADEIPTGVSTYDLGALPITPGLISAGVVNAAADVPIARDSDAAQQFAGDGFDWESSVVRKLRQTGVRSVQVLNRPSNVIAGQTAWLRTTPDVSLTDDLRRSVAEQWALTATARSADRFPATLVGQVSVLRNRLSGAEPQTSLFLPASAIQQLLRQRTEQLESVQQGRIPVVIEANTDAEIDAALRAVSGSSVKPWILGCEQLQPFANRLVKDKVGVIATPVTSQSYDWYISDLVEASQAGVPLLLAGDNGHKLRLTATKMVEAGLSPTAARQILTRDAEGVFGTGPVPLEVGADAALVVWSDDPLQLSAKPIWISFDQPTQPN